MKFSRSFKFLVAAAGLGLTLVSSASAQLLFTQYYEGTATNKWIEVKNVGSTTVDLSLYTISLYSNAGAENWKSGTTSTFNFALTGTLAADSTILIGNTANTLPFTPASVGAITNNSVANFNGNDSVVLWLDAVAFSTSQIVDAISFTEVGNQGPDRSFVRLSTQPGYNLTTGSSVTDFSGVWSQVTLATVAEATSSTDNYLGYSSLTAAVPEPSTYAMILCGLGFVGFVAYRRRRSGEA